MSKQVLWHFFSKPVPYEAALRLQENLHYVQLYRRRWGLNCPDILLLLEHRPVYTTGRRQLVDTLVNERHRLQELGAEWIATSRGGETTFHGPGQIVGYPLLDLRRMSVSLTRLLTECENDLGQLSVREYVSLLQKTMTSFAHGHGVSTAPSDHTGVFVSPTAKLGSIGVQVRHRFTTHGFSINITEEPIPWFRQVVACGLPSVEAVSIAGVKGSAIGVNDCVEDLKPLFGSHFGTKLHPASQSNDEEVQEMLYQVERAAALAGSWKRGPGQ
jgi:lipoate-protein ligase B